MSKQILMQKKASVVTLASLSAAASQHRGTYSSFVTNSESLVSNRMHSARQPITAAPIGDRKSSLGHDFSKMRVHTDAKALGPVAAEDESSISDQPAPAAPPVPAPPAAPPAPAAPAPAATPLTVTISTHLQGASSPAGMADRIPPRVDTPVTVGISGWRLPMRDVTLSIDGAGGGNGSATIDGAATKDLSADATVQLRGVDQTDVGKAGSLRLVASLGGSRLASSGGFSVSAIPENYTDTFLSLLTGANRGFVVQDGWSSDSGVFADLDQTEISEEVQYAAGTGCFAGVGKNNSGYLPGNILTPDTHSTPVALLTSPGSIIANQTCKFKDNRSGSVDIPMKNSGFKVGRFCMDMPVIGRQLSTVKLGASTTANGIASNAGTCSVSKMQAV